MTIRLLTTEEVAERFRTSPATVRYWRHIGMGPAGVRVGRRVLRRGGVRSVVGVQGRGAVRQRRPVISTVKGH
jgi:hypothetical protein